MQQKQKEKLIAMLSPTKVNQKECDAWAGEIATITRYAKKEGITTCELEELFKIGDKRGRVWQSWLAGDRCARKFTRERIRKVATTLGWYTLNEMQQKFAEAGGDEDVLTRTEATPCPISSLPHPPDQDIKAGGYTARAAARALLEDAQRSNLSTRESGRERATKPIKMPHATAFLKYDGLNEADAQTFVKTLIATENEHNVEVKQKSKEWRTGIDEIIKLGIPDDQVACKILLSQMTAVYRRMGYK